MKIKIIKDYKRYCVRMAAACAKKAHAATDQRIKDFFFNAEKGFLNRI
jgi:hypothetical protein